MLVLLSPHDLVIFCYIKSNKSDEMSTRIEKLGVSRSSNEVGSLLLCCSCDCCVSSSQMCDDCFLKILARSGRRALHLLLDLGFPVELFHIFCWFARTSHTSFTNLQLNSPRKTDKISLICCLIYDIREKHCPSHNFEEKWAI